MRHAKTSRFGLKGDTKAGVVLFAPHQETSPDYIFS